MHITEVFGTTGTTDKTTAVTTEFTSTSTSSILSSTLPVVSTTEDFTESTVSTETTVVVTNTTVENQYQPTLFKAVINTTDSPTEELLLSEEHVTSGIADISYTEPNNNDDDDFTTVAPTDYTAGENDYDITEGKLSRQQRSVKEDNENSLLKMVPGVCLAGCAQGFYLFTIISFIINWFGATGRIGNILLNFR